MSSTNQIVGTHVCVIGTGVLGLVAIKNLREQGLQVTALERNEQLGGSWHVSENTSQVTATALTTANISKHTSCFTDFPYEGDVAVHPSSKSIDDYLRSYANHFDLLRLIHFSTTVLKAERDEKTGQWIVYTRSTTADASATPQRHEFDRLVVATGILNTKNVVELPGQEKFGGEILHSREFKDAYRYTGKNVLVVGIGATGADTTSFLKTAGAVNIYLSHRGQTYLLPRMVDGKAFDHSMTYRQGCIMRYVGSWFPTRSLALMTNALRAAQFKAFPWLKEHGSFTSPRRLPGAPMLHRVPVFSDDLAENLKNEIVKSVVGIHEVSGPRSVTFTDGSTIHDLDAIIVCSGYHYDFSVVSGAGNPVDPRKAPDGYRQIQSAPYYQEDNPFPRLYHGFISEQFPDSLAFLGHMLIPGPPFVTYDLATMALASVWSGGAALPSSLGMKEDIDNHYDFITKALHNGPVPHPGVRINSKATWDWLNRTAGTSLVERLGNFGIEACKLWWSDRRFYNMLMDGVNTPAVYRLFDTGSGRKPWSGARVHIERINEEVQQMEVAWALSQAK